MTVTVDHDCVTLFHTSGGVDILRCLQDVIRILVSVKPLRPCIETSPIDLP